MSNDKPTAVAIIKFYPNKHVEVTLNTIRHITPRTLDIASHILLKTYKGMKAQFIADEHKRIREEKKEAETNAIADEAAFHEAEDERLAAAAVPDQSSIETPEAEEPEEVVPVEGEAPQEEETTEEETVNDNVVESEDKPEVA